jgi:hypothetical protein
MFETVILPYRGEAGVEGALHPIDWAGIVARLSAARDLRALFARPDYQGGGFAPHTARGIAGIPGNERSINFAALGGCKWVDATTAAATLPVDHGDRDKR